MDVTFGFSGLKLKDDLKLKITNSVSHLEPFALRSPENSKAIFFPGNLLAVYFDESGAPTVQKCVDENAFLNMVGIAVLNHREFTVVPKNLLDNLKLLD